MKPLLTPPLCRQMKGTIAAVVHPAGQVSVNSVPPVRVFIGDLNLVDGRTSLCTHYSVSFSKQEN